jgi:hypothetical protein
VLNGAIINILLITEHNGDVSPENVSLSSRHEVLTAVLLPIQALEDVTLFRSVKSSGRFGGTWGLQLRSSALFDPEDQRRKVP